MQSNVEFAKVKKTHVVATLFAALWVACAQAQVLTIAGSTTLQKRLLEPGAEALRTASGIQLKIDGIGTGKGMLALYDGTVPASAASESLQEAIASSMKASHEMGRPVNSMNIPLNLQFHELAKDRIVVIVNKANPVGALTKEQLKDIHTGKTRNWSEVGGPNVPIKVITSHAGSATRAVFQRQMLGNAEMVAGAVMVTSTALEIEEVSKAKGGIGAVSEGFLKLSPGQTRAANAPVLTRPLGLVTVGEPQPVVKKVIEYYRSPEGQKWFY